MVAAQGMNIEILSPQGKIKYPCQPITCANAVQVEFDHRIKCTWATFLSLRQELVDVATRYLDDDRVNEQTTPDNTTTDAENDHPMEEKTEKHTPNPTTQTANQRKTRLRRTHQDTNEQAERIFGADSSHSFHNVTLMRKP